MKKKISLLLSCYLILCNAFVCVAQTEDPCDRMRSNIQRLEQLDITSLAPAVRELYKESLLKVYRELAGCLESKIKTTNELKEKAKGTDTEQTLNAKLISLRGEESQLQNKILILEIALNQPGSAPKPPAAPGPPSTADIVREVQPVNTGNVNGTAAGNGVQPVNSMTATAPVNPAPAPTAPEGTGASTPATPQDPCSEVIAGVDYPDPPPVLLDIVNRSAADVVRRNSPDRSVFTLSQMVLYTIFDAASENSAKQLRELEVYQYLSETARTDKQLGPAPNSEGAVSAIEKPSFARLLGFAIEHGGITKKNDGTNLTLSTSLYSLYAMSGGDTAERYQEAGFLNRIGVAATFALDDQNNELANVRRNNLSEWSARVRLFGDRSTRSSRFQRFWDLNVRPLIRQRLVALGSSVESLSEQLQSYDAIERLSRRCLPGLVQNRMAQGDYTGAVEDEKKRIIATLILQHLRANIFNQVRDENGRLKLNAEQISQIEGDFLPRLKTALDNLVLADAQIKKEIADLMGGPQATFAYTNFRIPTGSDYSETKFLFEQDKGLFRPLKLVGNLGLSFYNKPDPLLNQKRVRDFSAALSFEGSSRSPFTEGENESRITYAFVGRYQRLFENRRLLERKPDIGAFQFVVEIPFIKGFSLPFSATYANATEEEKKNHFRFNFGMRLDTDKLFELLRTAASSR